MKPRTTVWLPFVFNSINKKEILVEDIEVVGQLDCFVQIYKRTTINDVCNSVDEKPFLKDEKTIGITQEVNWGSKFEKSRAMI